MQGLLSFENAPPFAAPLRFFLTAPLFGVLAGLLIAFEGGDAFASRWTPAALAATHLVTVGFMLQIMLGALIQILPVVAGANLKWPLGVSRVVHAGLSLGALLLAAGFELGRPVLLITAAILLCVTVVVFLVSAGAALIGVPSTSPTIRGLKLALGALAAVVGMGVVMALALAYGWPLALPSLADLHAGWGLGGWAGVLLAAMAYVVVPMFQLTPGYPAKPGWWYPVSVLGILLIWSIAIAADWAVGVQVSQATIAIVSMAFAGLTLRLQSKRRRAKADATYRYWQLGLVMSIFGLFLLLTASIFPALAEHTGWTLFFGVVLVAGGFIPFIAGMLYKIVPFLAWLHLQNRGQAKVPAPPMNKLLPDRESNRQFGMYCGALALMLAAVWFPDGLALPAGLGFAVANGWFGWNLLRAVRRYRLAGCDIDAKLAARA